MTQARDKLLEAVYFLERMTEVQAERHAFRYNLSAFLSAARSVTFVMQGEFGDVSGFKDWYEDAQSTMRGDNLMRLLKEKRDTTVHKQAVRPRAGIGVSRRDGVALGDSASIDIARPDGTVERGESQAPRPRVAPRAQPITDEWRWYFRDLPDNDVVAVCKEHIAKLESLVRQCESRFAS